MFDCSFREACKLLPRSASAHMKIAPLPLLNMIRMRAVWRSPTGRKSKKFTADVEFPSNQRANFRVFGQVTGYADDGAGAGDGKSDAHCTCWLGERNNTNTDFRHMDNSGRTDVQSTRRDNN